MIKQLFNQVYINLTKRLFENFFLKIKKKSSFYKSNYLVKEDTKYFINLCRIF